MAHLTVVCPRCQSQYQVDPGLRGKKMRCPNTICRAIIDVGGEPESIPAQADPAPARMEKPTPTVAPIPPAPSTASSPEAVVPTVQRKPVVEPEQEAWDDFPGDDEPTPETELKEPIAAPMAAPPVRRAIEKSATPLTPRTPVRQSETPVEAKKPRLRKSVSLGLIVAGASLLLLAMAAFTWFRIAAGRQANTEATFAHAEELYRQHDYQAAAQALQKLVHEDPYSPLRTEIRLLAEWVNVKQATLEGADKDPVESLNHIREFLGIYRSDPIFARRQSDVWQTLFQVATDLVKLGKEKRDPQLLKLAQEAVADARKLSADEIPNRLDIQKAFDTELSDTALLLRKLSQKDSLLGILRGNRDHPSAEAVVESRTLVEKSELKEDVAVLRALEEVHQAHRASIAFQPWQKPGNLGETPERGISLVLALPTGPKAEIPATGDLALALVRGVLHGLNPKTGEVVWARRVGVDSTHLPGRFPAETHTPPSCLVCSSDERTVSLVKLSDGGSLWIQELDDVVVGRPVAYGDSVFLATYGGKVTELDRRSGRKVGTYPLGQRLRLGGIRQPETPFIFFPAEETCIYVIDAEKRENLTTAFTMHPAGATIALPSFLPSSGGTTKLLWPTRRQGNEIEVSVLPLPLTETPKRGETFPSFTIAPETEPWWGPRQLAFWTEAGRFAVRGLRQPPSRDPLVFNETKEDFLPPGRSPTMGSAVLHQRGQEYWVAAGGRIHRLARAIDPVKGPIWEFLWENPPEVGLPVHETQILTLTDGTEFMVFVGQDPESPICTVSALHLEKGEILWQRQLGVLPHRSAVVTKDAVFMPTVHGVVKVARPIPTTVPWVATGEWVFQGEKAERRLWSTPSDLWSLAWKKSNVSPTTVHLSHVSMNLDASKPTTKKLPFPAEPVGGAGQQHGVALVPLANGVLARLDLAKATLTQGPDWRQGITEHSAEVTPVEEGLFAVTNGQRGLFLLHWPDEKVFEKRAAFSLSHRIVGPALATPQGYVVASVDDRITLLDKDRLSVIRQWHLPGKLSAGPWNLQGMLLCLVGKSRLVALDLSQEEFRWQFDVLAEVVGAPVIWNGGVVVADFAGNLHLLERQDGSPIRAPFRFRGDVAPSHPPVVLDENHLLTPLSDGTFYLLRPTDLQRP